jgi:hypothetical protein
MIRDIGGADGSEEDGIVLLQLLEAVVRDVLSSLLVGIRAPVVVRKVEFKGLERLGQGLENINTSLDYLGANTIGRDGGDAVRLLDVDGTGRHDDTACVKTTLTCDLLVWG